MKELNCKTEDRWRVYNLGLRIVTGETDIESMRRFPEELSSFCKNIGECLALLCEDCDILEAEVNRLREENETLKKQMEDDLK